MTPLIIVTIIIVRIFHGEMKSDIWLIHCFSVGRERIGEEVVHIESEPFWQGLESLEIVARPT